MSSELPAVGPASPKGTIWARVTGKEGGYALILILCALGGYAFLFQGMRFFLVPSASMEPLLFPNDHIVTVRKNQYERGDVVVIRDTREGGYFVKRLVGLGGDTINLEFGAAYRNGSYLSEPYLAEPMRYSMETPLTVPEDHVFVLGDNRNHSLDSGRTRETWPAELIVGKVVFRYYPYDRFGRIAGYRLLSLDEIRTASRPAP